MNDNTDHNEDGVVLERLPTADNLPAVFDTAMAGALARAEIDTQVATAHQFPRSIQRALGNIKTLATLDEQTAIECIYALKRGGKPLRGPSIRLAEIIATQWGNNRSGAVVVAVDRANKMIVAEGFFHDLETNAATKATVQRRISGRDGKLYSDDMIVVTGNAACAIAKRNAILGGVPKAVWRAAVDAAEQIIRGDAKTLVERRDGAVKALAHFNLSPEQIFAIIEVNGIDDIDLDDLVTLRTIFSSLKNGEQTVEELLRGTKFAPAQPAHKTIANPLKDTAPEEAGKTAAEAGKADDKPATGAAADASGTDSKPADGSATAADPLAVARERGAAARNDGKLRKNMPDEYRAADRKAEGDAWLAGFDAAGKKQS